jgi:hypothetical protein
MKNLLLCLLLLSGCHSLAIVRGPNRNVDKLDIEVDWTTPAPPPAPLLQAISNQIKMACDPAVQVNFILDDDLSAKAKGEWTAFDLKALALLHRTKFEGRFYVLWADGHMKNKPAVGGYSWGKRAFAVFPSVSPSQDRLRSTVSHETFHNLGLVGKFLKMQTFHKHSYGNHCSTINCLMQPASTGPIYNLCPFCLADLEAGEEN